MGRKRKSKFELGTQTNELIAAVEKTLSERGAIGINAGELIEEIIKKTDKEIINKFVSEKTPLSYKVQKLLDNEQTEKDLIAFADKLNFGLSPL